MTSRFLGAGILIGISALFVSCDSGRKPVDPALLDRSFPARNEIYVSGPDRLTLDEFERLRSEFPTLTPDSVARLALDSQYLARSWRARAGGSALGDAVRCVRALLAPAPSPPEIRESEALIGTAFGREGRAALAAELDRARRSRVIEWNRPAARDLGIRETP